MLASDIQLLAQALAAIATLVAIFITLRKKNMKFPVVKGGYPILGHVFTMLKGTPWGTMSNWIKDYGLTYQFHLFGSDCLSVADPEFLKFILHTKLTNFKKDLEFTYQPFLVLLGKGIVSSEGAEWKRQRLHLSSTLRVDILELMPEMTIKAVIRLCKRLDEVKKTGESIEMAEEFRHLTLNVIGEAVLSITPEESDATFAVMYLPIVTEGNLRTWDPTRMYIPNLAWFRHRAAVKKLNDYVSSIIVKRWEMKCAENKSSTVASTRKSDILDKIMETYTESTWNESAIEQIRDEIKTFILAGHETSASMLTWALFELVKNQQFSKDKNNTLMNKIQEDTKKVLGKYLVDDSAQLVTSIPPRSVCDQLIYAECCLRESLRRYSVVPTVVRVAAETIEYEGSANTPKAVIPQGTTIMINIQGVHHHESFWPEPMVYKPERFIKGMEAIAPYTFLPFIDGPRMCMGQFLSLLESKIVLSILTSKYSFTIVNTNDAGDIHPFMVPIIPKVGHWMKIQ